MAPRASAGYHLHSQFPDKQLTGLAGHRPRNCPFQALKPMEIEADIERLLLGAAPQSRPLKLSKNSNSRQALADGWPGIRHPWYDQLRRM